MWFPKARTLSLQDVTNLCDSLSDSVSKSESIDHVVSIERGGWYVGKIISENLGIQHTPITVGRFEADELIKLYSHFPSAFRIIPIVWQAILFKTKTPKLIKKVYDEKNICNKNILIVDDVVQSGKSIRVAQSYLKSLNPKSIKTASIANFQGSLVHHDCDIKKTLCYPWSRISSDYKMFCDMHEACHQQ